MPYSNFPKSIPTGKIDKCVHDVMGKGHDKPSAIAICYSSLVGGKELNQAMKEFTLAQKQDDNAELTADELGTIDHLYLDLRNSLTDKAMVNPGNPGGGSPTPGGGSSGHMSGKHKKCYMHLTKLGAGDAEARRVCRIALGGSAAKAKEIHYRLSQKAITDAPNLRGDSMQSCLNCKYAQPIFTEPENDNAMAMPMQSMMMETKEDDIDLVCTEYEFETDCEWVCDSWTEIPPQDQAMTAMRESAFSVVKQKDGAYRWFLFTTSSYQDKDGEIISQKAQEDDTARMQAANDYGILNWYHWYRYQGVWHKSKELTPAQLAEATPIKLGTCDLSAMQGRVRIESGLFDDNTIAEQFALRQKELGASLEFLHPANEPDTDKVYHSIKTFARAILPKERASNRLTQLAVAVAKEKNEMDIKETLSKLLGGDKAAEDKAQSLIQAAEKADQDAQAAKLASKEAQTEDKPADDKPKDELPTEPKFIGDIPIAEYEQKQKELIVNTLAPIVEALTKKLDAANEAQAVAAKESSKTITDQFAQITAKQAELDKRLAELEGLKPRAYRPTQDASTITSKETVKEKTPKTDQQANDTLSGWLSTPSA